MTEDPVRLLSQEDDAFTRSLLRSAKEGDRDDARAHKALVLGAAGGAAAGTAALVTAARFSSKGFFASAIGKWIFAGLVLATGVGGAALVWPRGPAAHEATVDPQAAALTNPLPSSGASDDPRRSQEPAIASGSREIAPTPRDPSSPPLANEPASNDERPAAPASAPRPPAEAGRAASGAPATPADAPRIDRDPSGKQASAAISSATAAAPPTTSAPGLAEEVVALKAAREALAKGQAARCLDAVNAYFAAFPAGHLSAEARYLRVEATLASGRADEAKVLARSMLAANPRSPYAARLRTIAGDDPAP